MVTLLRLAACSVPASQFSMVVPHLRTVPPLAARCSVAAHCASLRVLATSALRAFGRSQAHSRLSLVPTIRNSRLASSHRARLRRPGVPPLRTPLCPVSSGLQPLRGLRLRAALPLASLLCSLDFRFACFAHCARRSFVPIGLTTACFVPQFAIVVLLRYRLQVSFAHWTSASPVSRTARGEAPSHWRRPSCAPFSFR